MFLRERHRHSRGAHDGAHHGGGGTWLVSYADMVTLIMAFFIVMYTMSQIDINKLKALVGSLDAAFDPKPMGFKFTNKDQKRSMGEQSLVPGGNSRVAKVAPSNGVKKGPSAKGPGDQNKSGRPQRSLEEVAKSVQELARKSGLSAQVKATVTARGTVISFAETADGLANVVPFASGSAELTPGFRDFLDKVAPLLRDLTNKVEVQGHTDRRPIRTVAYPSNWELSAARAGSVVRYFVGNHGLGAHQFVCSGFADTVPVDPGNTEDAWAHNRRIEIVVTRNPAEVYDSLTRDQVSSQEVDITQPLGPKLFDIPLPMGQDKVPMEPNPNGVDHDAVTKAAHPGADTEVHEPAATEPEETKTLAN